MERLWSARWRSSYNSVWSIDSFSLISHTYQCPHAIQICGFTPVKIANFSKNRRKKGWKHRHLRVGPISKFRPWVLNFEKDPTFLTSLGSIKPTAGWPSPNLSICPAHRHQNRINFQVIRIPQKTKQGIGINSGSLQLRIEMTTPNLNPVLEITKPRSWLQKNANVNGFGLRVSTELVSCQKEGTIQKPPHVHSQQTKNIKKHKTNDSQTHNLAPWDSKPPRPPGKDEGRRAERRSSSCAFSGADLRQVLLQTMGISNEKEELWWLKYCSLEFREKDFDGMERSQQVDWPKSSQVQNVWMKPPKFPNRLPPVDLSSAKASIKLATRPRAPVRKSTVAA